MARRAGSSKHHSRSVIYICDSILLAEARRVWRPVRYGRISLSDEWGEETRNESYRDFLHDTVTDSSGRTEGCLGQGTLSPTNIRTGYLETVPSRIQ